MRLLLAIKIFFKTLFDSQTAGGVEKLLLPGGDVVSAEQPKVEKPQPAPKPSRSEAVTLLAAMQREARFVDFIQEPLDGFSDEQVGAVARDVHRDCRTLLGRIFSLSPLGDHEEEAEIELPAGFDAAQYRLTGNVSGEPPFRGRVTHHGWKATSCQLPEWSGSAQSARVVAPIEVEL